MGLKTNIAREANKFYADLQNAYLKIRSVSVANGKVSLDVVLYFDKESRDKVSNPAPSNNMPMPQVQDTMIQNFNVSFNETDLPFKDENVVIENAIDELKACAYRWMKENKYIGATDVFEDGQYNG